MKMELLITGASGLLGNNLAHYLKDQYRVTGVYNSNPIRIPGVELVNCDLSQEEETSSLVRRLKPKVVIHCASLVNLDRCEEDPDLSDQVNVKGTANLVNSLSEETKLIYISTDAVYGSNAGFSSEEEETIPCNYYGVSKLKGEAEAQKHSNSLIFRTNIFGINFQDKHSLAEFFLKQLEEGERIKGFEDAFFSSIYTFELARVLELSIQKDLKGIYNCASRNSCSKYEFAVKLAELFDFDSKLVEAVSIDTFPFKAKRAKNLTLDTKKIEAELGYKMPTVEYSIESFYRDIQSGLSKRIKVGSAPPPKIDAVLPYGRQWIDQDDIEDLVKTACSGWITQGPKVKEFEKELASITDSKYAVAVNSGTSALHIACLALGVQAGDELLTSAITFVASSNCGIFCGAKPVFADINPETYNITPEEIEKKITASTKVVIPVHFAGQSCDMEGIARVVAAAEKKYGTKIYIIEDASHALGSSYQGKKVGSCQYSHVTVMSFHPVKHITTGEGGAALTNDEELCRRMQMFSSHGITRDPKILKDNLGPWYYEQVEIGFNYRITDIQCALGVSQLKKLDFFKKNRRKIVNQYNEAFRNLPHLTVPYESETCNSNFHLYVILYDFEKVGITRNEFKDKLAAEQILTQIHYIPVHTQPYYQQNYGTAWGDLPHAESYYQRCLSLPLYPGMTDNDVEKVIQTVTNVCQSIE